MGGVVNTVKNVVSNPVRAVTAVSTFGTSELARRSNIPIASQVARLPETASNSLLGTRFGKEGAPDLQGFQGGQDPATFLAQTGGASLLANISMGVSPTDALAGYFGKSTKDGSWEEFLGTVNQKDLDAINSVNGQLTSIQSNTDLRQKAVDNVIADFPNLAKNAAQARAQAGGEFDTETRKYMEMALGDTAAKYAAGGQISSGAANEAFARVGAEQALNKLSYMGDREQYAYNTGANELNARLAEVNALRDFQNTMLTGQVAQGFSAQQANLQRQFQGDTNNVNTQNQQIFSNQAAEQASSNAMFGALGSLGGSFIGASLLSSAPRFKPPTSGYGEGPGVDTSQYAPNTGRRAY